MSVFWNGFKSALVALVAMTVFVAQCGPPGDKNAARQDTPTPPVVDETPTPIAPGAGAGTIEERVSCTEEVVTDRERHIEVLFDVRERYDLDSLLGVDGVWGLGVGRVRRDGKNTGELGIIVHSYRQAAPVGNDPWDTIPSTIEGCIVNLQVGAPPVPATSE